MKNISKISIGLSLCFTLLAINLSSNPEGAKADPLNETECFPAVLMLRGSGEGKADQTEFGTKVDGIDRIFLKTNGYQEDVLTGLLREFASHTDPDKTTSKVRFVGINYPALPVIPELNDSSAPLEQASANSMILMSIST